MKGSRETLANYITRKLEVIKRNKQECRNIVNYIVEQGFPEMEVLDVVGLRRHIIDCSDRMLYYLLKSIDEKQIEKYFSAKEQREYETTKFKPLRFSFPIRWEMVEIVEGSQWIGKITVKDLMKLRDAQLINYNERTQRTLRYVVNKDFEYYQIYLNRSAVDAITQSYITGRYIPNTITLNIPETAEFKYSDGELIISEADHLDIIDGYHRYIAMSNLFNQDRKFNYTMELRVVCFNEETAQQFIWQEDQKTKMRKLDSESLNQNSAANQVINLVNQNGLLRNIIGRNEGVIDQGLAASLIDKLWFNTPNNISRKQIIETKEEIIKAMNGLLDEDPGIFDKKWSYEFTVIAFCLIRKFGGADKLLDRIKTQTELMTAKEEYKLALGHKGSPINARIINRVYKFYEDFM